LSLDVRGKVTGIDIVTMRRAEVRASETALKAPKEIIHGTRSGYNHANSSQVNVAWALSVEYN
jgi:hypothetical protein